MSAVGMEDDRAQLTFLKTILALVNTGGAINIHVALLIAVTAFALEDTRLGAVGLGLGDFVS